MIMIFIWLIVMCYPIIGVLCVLDIIRSTKDQNTKVLWAMIVLLAPVIGAFTYMVIGRNSKNHIKA
ncbi:MAG: Phospholipase D-nuclease N-terminal [Mucilaginibacter sp.]|nr:Phospholipase D-nuclease N-terminal [Mucilaginibacter sp.]